MEGMDESKDSHEWIAFDSAFCRAFAASPAHAKVEPVSFDPPAAGREGLETYLAEIRRLPGLDGEAGGVYELAARGDEAARERIVLAHLNLVARIAFQYTGYGLPMADLISEGNLGLLRAAELFQPKYGLAFSTYAGVWIKQRMHRAITAQARVVRIPVWRSQRLRKLDRLFAELSPGASREAGLPEIAARLGISEETLAKLESDRLRVEPIDETPPEALISPDPHPIEHLSWEELREEIAACLHGLDDTELQIVARKFGLLDEEPESYREMAPRFGRSREWIRRVGEGALAKIRASFASMGNLPRRLVRARRKQAGERLRKFSNRLQKSSPVSLFQMLLMQWSEPFIAIL